MRIKIIVNPRAGRGRGRKVIPVIREFFERAGTRFDVVTTAGRGDATRLAREAARAGCDIVVAAGGDGTANEVANGIFGSGATLGVIPCGTGNDFALALGVSKNPVKACELLLNGKPSAVDVGRVLERYFVSSVGVGFDATVAQEANRSIPVLRGPVVYTLALIKVLFTYTAPAVKIRLDGREISSIAQLIAVTNAPSYGGGMKITPNAIMDDGAFEVCLIERMGSLETLFHFPKVLVGRHLGLAKVKMHRAREVEIEADRIVPMHMDGEVMQAKRLHFEIARRALPVIAATRTRLSRDAVDAAGQDTADQGASFRWAKVGTS